ncbi:glycosyltransferase [Desertivirga brevis]|uniref:glycosyltransferase n=1 Tax=Desertivirga brevis TaxID=2810310 RepID=UPI001A963CA6|nr:glycosyltransferase [Pedobacter sp. SYSU D00873]
MSDRKIDLVIFTCEGKEHLLPKTFSSLQEKCGYLFSNVILAIDGKVDSSVIDIVKPTIIVQNHKRSGYVKSIINALSLVKSPYFFWLEDDWCFNLNFDLNELAQKLDLDSSLCQVVLGKEELKSDGLTASDKDLYYSKFGFSANPCLCRTAPLFKAFTDLLKLDKNEATKLLGFESYLTDFMVQNRLNNLIKINDAQSYVQHDGYLESTAREFHMINSLDDSTSSIGKEYISGYGQHINISIKNKILMIPKVLVASSYLILKIFSSREVYDYAMRLNIGFKKRFKN